MYAKYDPRYLAETVEALPALLTEIDRQARAWIAGDRVVKIGNAAMTTVRVDDPGE